MATKTRVPAVDGWFADGEEGPALLGTKCTTCGTVFFPRAEGFCRNPACEGETFDEVRLSTSGTVWSFTENHYAPPAPYVSPDPFVPYTVAAVELAEEQIVVMGMVVDGVGAAGLHVGMPVELVSDVLYSDDEHEYTVWKWAPVSAGRN